MSGVPVELDRDEARELAERELADPRYDSEPPLLQRIIEWLDDVLGELLGAAGGALSGAAGLAVLALVVLLAALIVFFRIGPPSRRGVRREDVFGPDERRTAASHRSAADAAAAESRWADAVVERYRAVVATLEERSILDPRPGRTAHEAAAEAGALLPEAAERLAAGADTFDAVHYGGHAAAAADDRRLRELDDAVRRARPRITVQDRPDAAPAVRR